MRSYVIQILFFGNHFTVTRFWGRLRQAPMKLVMFFEDKSEMEKHVEQVLKKRLSSGYEIMEKSFNFPESPTLLMFGTSDFEDRQGKLF